MKVISATVMRLFFLLVLISTVDATPWGLVREADDETRIKALPLKELGRLIRHLPQILCER